MTLSFRSPAGDLTAAEAEHLFERFWRKDQARTGGRHHGLGLSLASEFARLLGGALTAQLVAGDLVFTLRLPAAGSGGIPVAGELPRAQRLPQDWSS